MPHSKNLELPASTWEILDVGGSYNEDGLDHYLHKVLNHCMQTFRADAVSLFLRLEGSDTFLLSAQLGEPGRLPPEATFQMGHSIAGIAAARRESLLIDSPEKHPALKGVIKAQPRVGSAIVVPLLDPRSFVVGVINVSRQLDAPPFQLRDLKSAEVFGRVLALAVTNVRLFFELTSALENQKQILTRQSNILEAIPVAVLMVLQNEEVAAINSHAERIVGSKSNFGMHWEVVIANCQETLKQTLRTCIQSALAGKKKEIIVDVDDKNYNVNATPSNEKGAVVVIEDVTKALSKERETSKIKRLAEIGQMTAQLAHEIRNPLTSIRGAAYVLQREASLDEVHGWATVIEHESHVLNQLCEEFLDFARSLSLSPISMNLNELIKQITKGYEVRIKKQNVYLQLHLDELPEITADPVRMTQALHNLIRNALDAMPEGGQLMIQTSFKKPEVIVQVSDTGYGIPLEKQSNLFTPFFTTKPDGTGLGLCNTQRIIEAHGGKIRFSSIPESGTVFTIQLPIKNKRRKSE